MLLNLLSNAIKYSKRGTILVTVNILKQENQEALIEVKVEDEGIGINQDEKEKLFKPFQVLSKNKSRASGISNGFGLSVC